MPTVKIHKGLAGHDVATDIVLSLIGTKALAERNGTLELEDFQELGIDGHTALKALRDNEDLIDLTRENELPAGFTPDAFAGLRIVGMKFEVELMLKPQKPLPFDSPKTEEDEYYQSEHIVGLAHYRARESMLDGKRVLNVSRFTRAHDSSEDQPVFVRVREIWTDRPIDEGTAEEVFEDLVGEIQGDFECPMSIEGVEELIEECGPIVEVVLSPGPSEEIHGRPAFAFVWHEEEGCYLALERVDGKWLVKTRIDKSRAEDVREDWEQFLDDVWPVLHQNDTASASLDVPEDETVPVEATEESDDAPTPIDKWPDAELFVEDPTAWPENDVRFEIVIGTTNVSVEACRGVEYDELKASYFKGERAVEKIARFRSIRAKDAEELEKIASEWLEKELAE